MTEVNRPYRDFFKEVVAADPVANPKDHLVVGDEANMANIIRGKGVPTPPATNRGHFHIGHDEFWFILEGKCDYLIEDAGLFTADMPAMSCSCRRGVTTAPAGPLINQVGHRPTHACPSM